MTCPDLKSLRSPSVVATVSSRGVFRRSRCLSADSRDRRHRTRTFAARQAAWFCSQLQPDTPRCLCSESSVACYSFSVITTDFNACHFTKCRQEQKSATEQPPRHPSPPLQEALDTLSGKRPADDGRVVRGSSRPAKDGAGGRLYLNVTGFPFPLGPLFARQTVRTEVRLPIHIS